MSYGRSSTPLLGGAEVQALVGAWKEIIGSGAASHRNELGVMPYAMDETPRPPYVPRTSVTSH